MPRVRLPLAIILTLPLLLVGASCGRAPGLYGSRAMVPEVDPITGVMTGPEHAPTADLDGAEPIVLAPGAVTEPAPAAPAGPLTPTAPMAPTPLVATRTTPDLVRIPGGSFVPLFMQRGESAVEVAEFEIDRHQVTRGEFLEFVRANPRWRRSEVKPIFADERYLADWPGDLDAGEGDDLRRPVTQISWFAAKAYCEAQGARLPTVDEWEYLAAASGTDRDATRDAEFLRWVLEEYTRPALRPLAPIGAGFRNIYGVEGLHGPVREWVLDYNTVMVSDDSRGIGARDHQLYCAAGAVGSTRTGDYAAFLRYTFRSGLNGRSTADNLGFRCAGGR